MLKQLSDVGAFFHKAQIVLKKQTSIESIAKIRNIGVPTLLKGCKVSTPTPKDAVGFKNVLAAIFVKDKGKMPPPIERTKTWCYMACGDVPFAGFRCIMVCVTCTTEWGGGCQISIYPPN